MANTLISFVRMLLALTHVRATMDRTHEDCHVLNAGLGTTVVR